MGTTEGLTVAEGPLVSIVLASYNMGRHIPAAVRSVQNQTYPHWELNIVDDGSTDGTDAVVAPFLVDQRIRYVRQTNGGQAKAKNSAIRASQGTFIAFIDADDMWLPEKLKKQLTAFEGAGSGVGVVYSDVAVVNEHGQRLPMPKVKRYSGRIAGRLLVDNFVTGMASMVKRECFDRVGLFDESLPMGIDYDLWLRISAHYEFLYLDEVTYLYRQWSGQMSHNVQKRMECALVIMNRFLRDHPHLVDKETVKEAWAHTYVGWGNALARSQNNKLKALQKHLKGLSFKITYRPAWLGIARVVVKNVLRRSDVAP